MRAELLTRYDVYMSLVRYVNDTDIKKEPSADWILIYSILLLDKTDKTKVAPYLTSDVTSISILPLVAFE